MTQTVYDYPQHIPATLSDEGQVWCFQASHVLPLHVALEMEEAIVRFSASWTYHEQAVVSFAKIFFGQFFVFYAEDISGCGTDKLFRFVKEQSDKYHLSLLSRNPQAFYVKNKFELLPLAQVKHAFDLGKIDINTPYVDNSISTMKALRTQWIIPLGESWLMDVVSES